MKRRQFIQTASWGSAAGVLGLSGCATVGSGSGPKVVVVGGGYGGATAAKYVRMWSDYGIQVTLVEPNASFVSCPISNLVIGGSKTMNDITTPYDNLSKRHGVNVVRGYVTQIDAEKRLVKLGDGSELSYDRLILSPGVDLMMDTLPGMSKPGAQDKILHAWKAGPQTLALRQQLEAMPNGGVFAITIPLAPYRCPPGPYERACQVASYFSKAKPKSKVLILDENDDVTSKGPLFKKAWAERYKGIIEYRPKHKVVDVDAATNTLKFEFNDDLKANVLNVLPMMRAGDIAVKTGLATANKRWCQKHSRFGRFHPGRALDAQVRSHGQPARQDLCGSCGGLADRQASECHAYLQQHLLQLCQRRRCGARGQRAPLRRRKENHADRAWLGWRIQRRQRTGRALCPGMGTQHLGRYARLNLCWSRR
jgi:hypothetical protein